MKSVWLAYSLMSEVAVVHATSPASSPELSGILSSVSPEEERRGKQEELCEASVFSERRKEIAGGAE